MYEVYVLRTNLYFHANLYSQTILGLHPNFMTTITQSPSCLSAFPVALHSLNTKELLTIHFLVTWCRYSLFLGNLNDPLVNHQGLIFQGGKLLGVEEARTEEENVEEEIEERRNENDDYENNDEGRNKEE